MWTESAAVYRRFVERLRGGDDAERELERQRAAAARRLYGAAQSRPPSWWQWFQRIAAP